MKIERGNRTISTFRERVRNCDRNKTKFNKCTNGANLYANAT